jgi:hypothetical protein
MAFLLLEDAIQPHVFSELQTPRLQALHVLYHTRHRMRWSIRIHPLTDPTRVHTLTVWQGILRWGGLG